MSIYLSNTNNTNNVDAFAIMLRRMGYAAYVEQDGERTLLITNYIVNSISFTYLGER